MSRSLTDHLGVPIANEEGTRAAATALEEYPYDRLTAVYVDGRGSGSPDTLPVEQPGMGAEDPSVAFRGIVPDMETEITYTTGAVEAINDIAVEREANATAFRPRGGRRLVQSLSGDEPVWLVAGTELPVIAGQSAEEGQ